MVTLKDTSYPPCFSLILGSAACSSCLPAGVAKPLPPFQGAPASCHTAQSRGLSTRPSTIRGLFVDKYIPPIIIAWLIMAWVF